MRALQATPAILGVALVAIAMAATPAAAQSLSDGLAAPAPPSGSPAPRASAAPTTNAQTTNAQTTNAQTTNAQTTNAQPGQVAPNARPAPVIEAPPSGQAVPNGPTGIAPPTAVPPPPGSATATAVPPPPGSAILATLPPPPPPPGYEITAPGELPVSQTTATATARAPHRGRGVSAGRVAAETVGYIAGASASVVVMGIVGLGASAAACSGPSAGEFCSLAGLAWGAVFGSAASVALVPLGIYVAGNLDGGNGGYGWTMLGYLGGTLAGSVIVAGAAATNDDALTATGVVLFFVSQIVGSSLGYELSSDDNHAPRGNGDTALAQAPHIAPTLALDSHGALVGARGTF